VISSLFSLCCVSYWLACLPCPVFEQATNSLRTREFFLLTSALSVYDIDEMGVCPSLTLRAVRWRALLCFMCSMLFVGGCG